VWFDLVVRYRFRFGLGLFFKCGLLQSVGVAAFDLLCILGGSRFWCIVFSVFDVCSGWVVWVVCFSLFFFELWSFSHRFVIFSRGGFFVLMFC